MDSCLLFFLVPEKMPGNVMVRRDSEDNTVLLVSWEPLTIVEARGFITYEVMATPSSGSRKRQQQQALMTSVPYNMSMARLEGAAPGVSYAVQVTPRTSSQESGPGKPYHHKSFISSSPVHFGFECCKG